MHQAREAGHATSFVAYKYRYIDIAARWARDGVCMASPGVRLTRPLVLPIMPLARRATVLSADLLCCLTHDTMHQRNGPDRTT